MTKNNTKDYWGYLGILIFILMAVCPIVYSATHRSYEELKFYSLLIGGTAYTLIVGFYVVGAGIKHAFDDEEQFLINFTLQAIALIPLGGFFYYSLFLVIHDVSIFLYEVSNPHLNIILPALITLIFGITLYIVRLKQRLFYGLSEVLVGVVVAVSQARNKTMETGLENPQLYLAILTAGVYLVVRGLDNMNEGIKNKSSSTFLKKLFGQSLNDSADETKKIENQR